MFTRAQQPQAEASQRTTQPLAESARDKRERSVIRIQETAPPELVVRPTTRRLVWSLADLRARFAMVQLEKLALLAVVMRTTQIPIQGGPQGIKTSKRRRMGKGIGI